MEELHLNLESHKASVVLILNQVSWKKAYTDRSSRNLKSSCVTWIQWWEKYAEKAVAYTRSLKFANKERAWFHFIIIYHHVLNLCFLCYKSIETVIDACPAESWSEIDERRLIAGEIQEFVSCRWSTHFLF